MAGVETARWTAELLTAGSTVPAVPPEMTVVIPSHQRLHQVEALLDSVAVAVQGGPPPPAVEVVVVLDGSTDGSLEQLERRRPDFPVPLSAVWQENAGAGAARNRGIAQAHGKLVWMLDDDMVVDRQALERHLMWDRDAAPVLMGPCDVRSSELTASGARSWYAERYEALGRAGLVDNPMDVAFANTSAPTALMRDHRFDDRFIGYGMEDIELAVRLRDGGVAVAFDPRAAVSHAFTPTAQERLRKLRQEGRNRLRFLELHPHARRTVFEEDPGRLEALLRRLSRPRMQWPFWWLAQLLLLGRAIPSSARMRVRLLRLAEVAALYSGVAGGTPP